MFYHSTGSGIVVPPPLPHGSLQIAYGFPTPEGSLASCFDPECLRVKRHGDDGIDLIGKTADATANHSLQRVPLCRVPEQPIITLICAKQTVCSLGEGWEITILVGDSRLRQSCEQPGKLHRRPAACVRIALQRAQPIESRIEPLLV